MAMVGYGRVSSAGQSLDIQLEQLSAAGCAKVFSEKLSGRSADGRQALADALEWVREGDVFVVTRLDRCARSLSDLRQIIDKLDAKGVGFRSLQQGAIDTTKPEGRLMLNMLGAFAEFETDLRKDRQSEGIEKAKAAGVYKGRKATIDKDRIKALLADGKGVTAVAKELGVSRMTVYRVAEEA